MNFFLRRLWPAILAIGLSSSSAWAGFMGPDKVIDDWGNKFQTRSVVISTDTVVVLSSAAAISNLSGVSEWRVRIITNVGDAELAIYNSTSSFTIFESTRGVHLSSYTANSTYPRERTFYGNMPLYGIWGTAGTEGNAGLNVNEFYFK